MSTNRAFRIADARRCLLAARETYGESAANLFMLEDDRREALEDNRFGDVQDLRERIATHKPAHADAAEDLRDAMAGLREELQDDTE